MTESFELASTLPLRLYWSVAGRVRLRTNLDGMRATLADKAELTKILTYHVAAGRYTPGELAAGTAIKTLEGATVTPSKMGATYEVNKAQVVCGNVQTANATVYIIDTVLMPPSS